jgi:polyhydroxybutyrate depolymerase
MGIFTERIRHVGLQTGALVLLTALLAGCYFDDDDDDDAVQAPADAITETGRQTLMSSAIERYYYINLPADYRWGEDPRPLLLLLHGAGDSIDGWLAGGFQGDGLLNLAKEEAIVVIPNARVTDDGRRVWDPGTETDYDFLLDLLDELEGRVTFDERRIFITGHSAGGLMAHEYGCRFGDLVRGVAPSAGSITSNVNPQCVGSTAVLQLQSEFDAVVPPGITTATRDFWALYNGFDPDVTTPGITEPCVDYSLGASAYPVQWCLHDTLAFDGHGWWAKADEAIWTFFSSLPLVEPTMDPPPGGGNANTGTEFTTTIMATIDLPLTLGEVLRTGVFFYPADSVLPISGAPLYILNGDLDLGPAVPGTQVTLNIPVEMPDDEDLPDTFTLLIAVYVVGGSIPIPTPGVDHNVAYQLTVNDSTTPIVIPEVLLLEPVLP